jgi:hypothetical protein
MNVLQAGDISPLRRLGIICIVITEQTGGYADTSAGDDRRTIDGCQGWTTEERHVRAALSHPAPDDRRVLLRIASTHTLIVSFELHAIRYVV